MLFLGDLYSEVCSHVSYVCFTYAGICESRTLLQTCSDITQTDLAIPYPCDCFPQLVCRCLATLQQIYRDGSGSGSRVVVLIAVVASTVGICTDIGSYTACHLHVFPLESVLCFHVFYVKLVRWCFRALILPYPLRLLLLFI